MYNLLNRTLSRHIFQDMRLSRTSKLVYLGMRTIRKTTIAGYAEGLGIPYQTVRRAIRELQQYDWVYSYEHPESQEIIYVPWMPRDVEAWVAKEASRLAETAPNKGEFRAKAVLTIYVDDQNFLDNHRFKWAPSPETGLPMEFDRTHEDLKVVIEFQGRQHFEKVTFRTGESDLTAQMARDRAKMVACERKGFVLVEIIATELSCDMIIGKVDGLLPLIPPLKERPLYQTLDELCRSYAARARG